MARAVAAALIALLPVLYFQVVLSNVFILTNYCKYPVWPGVQSAPGSPSLDIGVGLSFRESYAFAAPHNWAGRIWGRTGCGSGNGGFSCVTGDCGSGQIACTGSAGAQPATLAEFTLGGADGRDHFDISLIEGFNLPIGIFPQSGYCTSTDCRADINPGCPPVLQLKWDDGSVVGCKSACQEFNSDQYCCRGAYYSTKRCRPTSYSEIFKAYCPMAFTYPLDHSVTRNTCHHADYVIEFCPYTNFTSIN